VAGRIPTTPLAILALTLGLTAGFDWGVEQLGVVKSIDSDRRTVTAAVSRSTVPA
jgi:hypothetical protein